MLQKNAKIENYCNKATYSKSRPLLPQYTPYYTILIVLQSQDRRGERDRLGAGRLPTVGGRGERGRVRRG